MFECSQSELRHELDALATQFEIYVRRRVTADEAFEDWREAFYSAFDNPQDNDLSETAAARLQAIL